MNLNRGGLHKRNKGREWGSTWIRCDASFFLAFHAALSTTKTQATRSTPSAPACSDAFGSTTRFPTTSKSASKALFLLLQMGPTRLFQKQNGFLPVMNYICNYALLALLCQTSHSSSPVGRACLRILDLACRSKFRSVPLTRSNTNRLRVMDLPNEVTSEPGPTHA